MGQVSRPIQIVLLAVAVFALAWFVALRPKAGDGAAPAPSPAAEHAPPGEKGLSSAVDKATGAVKASEAHAGKLGTASSQAGTAPATPAASPSATAPAGPPRATAPAGRSPAGGAKGAPRRAARALNAHKVLAMLFYNPRASDDRAVRRDFYGLPRHGGRVVLIAAPLERLASFRAVTSRVAVVGSPTVVVFDRAGVPHSYVGFADPAELAVRIRDALAGR